MCLLCRMEDLDEQKQKGFSDLESQPGGRIGSQTGMGSRAATGRRSATAETGATASQGENHSPVQGAAGLSQRGRHRAGRSMGGGAKSAELRPGHQDHVRILLAARLAWQV